MLDNFILYARYKVDNSKYYSNWLSSEPYQKDILINFLNNKNNLFYFDHPLFGTIEIKIKETKINSKFLIYEYSVKNTIVQLGINKNL